jgi:hypothetical protein
MQIGFFQNGGVSQVSFQEFCYILVLLKQYGVVSKSQNNAQQILKFTQCNNLLIMGMSCIEHWELSKVSANIAVATLWVNMYLLASVGHLMQGVRTWCPALA